MKSKAKLIKKKDELIQWLEENHLRIYHEGHTIFMESINKESRYLNPRVKMNDD